ncbi:hypothetical protein CIW52_17310 [Mycolicibacterium sp. P9-64]|nr:hypothetical protein CIW52_17310 [Mycolicibacterium sp. P9-64]
MSGLRWIGHGDDGRLGVVSARRRVSAYSSVNMSSMVFKGVVGARGLPDSGELRSNSIRK